MRYFRKPEAKTSCNIATKDIPADAHNPSSLESKAGYVRELQAVQDYIELYLGLPYSKKKVCTSTYRKETQEIKISPGTKRIPLRWLRLHYGKFLESLLFRSPTQEYDLFTRNLKPA